MKIFHYETVRFSQSHYNHKLQFKFFQTILVPVEKTKLKHPISTRRDLFFHSPQTRPQRGANLPLGSSNKKISSALLPPPSRPSQSRSI